MKKFSKKYSFRIQTEVFEKLKKYNLFDNDEIYSSLPFSLAGDLHIGHMFSLFVQDIWVRLQKKNSNNIGWILNFHDSSFLTYISMFKKGVTNTTDGNKIQVFKRILNQKAKTYNILSNMGLCADLDSSFFHLSQDYSYFVRDVFKNLYDKGVIYQDRELIYWDKQYQTIVGENDIIFSSKKKKFYSIRYFIDTKKDSVIIVTSRPDTICADVALAVNPMDKRYKKFIGKKVIIPIVNKAIPIIVDERVDMTKDNGIIRITPGHDRFSMILAKDHNLSLNRYAIDFEGNFTELAGNFVGKSSDKFFDNIVKYLEDISNLSGVCDRDENIAFCAKTGNFLEQFTMKQWFFKISNNTREHLKETIDFNELQLYPSSFKDKINKVIDNDGGWCISRQYYCGQDIPVWEDDDGNHYFFDDKSIINSYKKNDGNILMSLIIANMIFDGLFKETFAFDNFVEICLLESFSDKNKVILETYFDLVIINNSEYSFSNKEISFVKNLILVLNNNFLESTDYDKTIKQLQEVLDNTYLLVKQGFNYKYDLVSTHNNKLSKINRVNAVFDSSFLVTIFYAYMHKKYSGSNKLLSPSLISGQDESFFLFNTILFCAEYFRKNNIKNVFFHPCILDKYGNKINFESDFNLEIGSNILDMYGSDEIKLAFLKNYSSAGFSMKSNDFKESNNFLNKIWNASRFIFSQTIGQDNDSVLLDIEFIKKDIENNIDVLNSFDHWILYEFLDLYNDFSLLLKDKLFLDNGYAFINNIIQKFCDQYLEIIKIERTEKTNQVLLYCVSLLLKMLNPYLPIITEKLWDYFKFSGVLFSSNCIFDLSIANKNYKIHLYMNILNKFIDIKNKLGIKKHEQVDIYIQATNDFSDYIKQYESILIKIINIKNILYIKTTDVISDGYLCDTIIDIHIGLKKVEYMSKKDHILEIKKLIDDKKQLLQHIRVVLSSAQMSGKTSVILVKQTEIESLKEDIGALEHQLNKLKFDK